MQNMIIWFIGIFFTWGFVDNDKPGFWGNFLIMFFWPMLLGMALRTYFDKKGHLTPTAPDQCPPPPNSKPGNTERGTGG